MPLFADRYLPAFVQTYLKERATPEDPLLAKIARWTQENTDLPIMLTGHPYGILLEILCRAVRPRVALEIGAFTGYSTIVLARALPPDGRLITFEKNRTLQPVLTRHLEEAGVAEKVLVFWEEAERILPQLPYRYDFVFLDSTKQQYRQDIELLLPRLNPGALLVIDNTLWEGSVFHPEERSREPVAASVDALNQWLATHPDFRTVILPFRDGVTLALYLPQQSTNTP